MIETVDPVAVANLVVDTLAVVIALADFIFVYVINKKKKKE